LLEVTALTSVRSALALRVVVGATLLAPGCQLDSSAEFEDVATAGTAGSGASGGTDATEAGMDAGGAGATGNEGGSEMGGKSGGTAGAPTAGKATAEGGRGGKGGTTGMGGSMAGTGTGGKGGAGGSGTAGGGMAGSAGSAGTGGTASPQPETLETRELEDATIVSCFPNQTMGNAATLNVDGDFTCSYYALISVPLAGVPAAATVSKATLTLECENAGDAISISYAGEPWKEATVRWSTRPESGPALGTVRCEEPGPVVIDLKAAVVAWLGGDRENYGIYLRTEHTDGTDFTSSESEDTEHRPLLSITYTPPIK
jgi:hypothetical protein